MKSPGTGNLVLSVLFIFQLLQKTCSINMHGIEQNWSGHFCLGRGPLGVLLPSSDLKSASLCLPGCATIASPVEFWVSPWSTPMLPSHVAIGLCPSVPLQSPGLLEQRGNLHVQGFETAYSSLLIAGLSMKRNDSKETWKKKTLPSRWAQTMTRRTEQPLSIFESAIIYHQRFWKEGPSPGVRMSSKPAGERQREVTATRASMWGHREPTSCWRDSPRWPSFRTTSPDTALQSTTLITWWHTKQFWCKVELTEQQREGSASRQAAWGIHSRWLQPSQPRRQSEAALANKEDWFVFQEDKHRGGWQWVEPP